MVNDEFNAVYVYGEAVGETMFYGPGAGSLPTATAIVSDLVAVMKNMRLGVNGKNIVTPQFEKKLKEPHEIHSKYFLRLHRERRGRRVCQYHNDLFSNTASVLKKSCSFPLRKKDAAEIVVVTHQASYEDYEEISSNLRDLDVCVQITSSLSRRREWQLMRWKGLVAGYKEYLPVTENTQC